MSALFDAFKGDAGQNNVIDMSLLPEGNYNASELPCFGDGALVSGLCEGQHLHFADEGTAAGTNYYNITVNASGGQIHVEDGAHIDGLSVSGMRAALNVAGSIANLDAQGAHVLGFTVHNTGHISGANFGEATLDTNGSHIAGTLIDANFRDANLTNVHFETGAFLQNANFTGATMQEVHFASGVHLEDIHVDAPLNGRSYFNSIAEMPQYGNGLSGTGVAELSAGVARHLANQATAIEAHEALHNKPETTPLDPSILDGLRNLHGGEDKNPLLDGAELQTALLDGQALKDVNAAKEANAVREV